MKFVVNDSWTDHKEEIAQFISHYEEGGEVLYSKRNMVKKFTCADGKILIIKRYKVPNLAQRIACSTYHKSKAARAYDCAVKFLEKGVSTPFPVAYMELTKGGLFRQGFFVSTEDTRPSCSFLRTAQPRPEGLMDAVAAFILRLHTCGILHGDLNLSNILHEDVDGEYHLSVIDTNRTKFVAQPSPRQCLDNMMRMTHDRSLSAEIVGRYAAQRGWDSEKSVDYVARRLDWFELKKDITHTLTGRSHVPVPELLKRLRRHFGL